MNSQDEELIAELYNNDEDDGWCGHDISCDALNNIIKRVRSFDKRKANDREDVK